MAVYQSCCFLYQNTIDILIHKDKEATHKISERIKIKDGGLSVIFSTDKSQFAICTTSMHGEYTYKL